MTMKLSLIATTLTALLLSSGASISRAGTEANILITDVPHIRQKPDFCGEACAAMMLRKLGITTDQDAVFDLAGIDPTKGRGAYAPELARALRRIGFKTGPVWHKINAHRSAAGLDKLWTGLHADLKRGIASIVCMHYDDQPGTTEHFRLVLGYDPGRDEVIYHEPAEDNGAYRRMARQHFLKLWPLKYEADQWTVIRMALEPGNLQAPTPSLKPTDADYAQHIRALKAKLPRGFTVVLQKPFVVVGDESAEMVRKRAAGTVAWAVKHLESSYFNAPPKHILNVWLFRDEPSYRKHTKAFFNHEPDTPFGYYSPSAKALIMNIATGGGTLVHEIVHPYMESNFPDVPAWFNEGLGSLYEQSHQRNGKIVGLTNWRLAGLKRAMKEGRIPSFKTLTGTTDQAFYHRDTGDNYAQARYLLYYLQEKNLLRPFYRAFHRNRALDPTGYKTLVKILGSPDMVVFEKHWRKFVMGLRC